MRKLKSLVCGSKFGQFYIDAISKMKECVEFIGIFSNDQGYVLKNIMLIYIHR